MVSNKLRFFNLISAQPIEARARMPEFTTQQTTVVNWLNEGHCVVARNVLNGHSGEGISLLNNVEDLNSLNATTGGNTPLFVKYVKKRAEFRIHFMRSVGATAAAEVIDTQKKGLRGDQPREEVNFQIRNHQNGYVYIREGFMVPPDVVRQAVLAFEASGLHFGAVDVIWNELNGQAWVLEINCAPGLSGTTITNYVEGFRRLFPH
jgi:glutathione synthase/RimK-type ligase-like ATP-grasp enzyme